MSLDAEQFMAKWAATGAAERANFQPFCGGLCDLLGVARPDGQTPTEAENAYVFEKNVPLHQPDGSTTTGRIDLYKRDHFVMEGKQGAEEGAVRKGHGTRGSTGWDKALVRAKKQGYVPLFILLSLWLRVRFIKGTECGDDSSQTSPHGCPGSPIFIVIKKEESSAYEKESNRNRKKLAHNARDKTQPIPSLCGRLNHRLRLLRERGNTIREIRRDPLILLAVVRVWRETAVALKSLDANRLHALGDQSFHFLINQLFQFPGSGLDLRVLFFFPLRLLQSGSHDGDKLPLRGLWLHGWALP